MTPSKRAHFSRWRSKATLKWVFTRFFSNILFSLDTINWFKFYEVKYFFPQNLYVRTSQIKALSLMLLFCFANITHCLRICSSSFKDDKKHWPMKKSTLSFIWEPLNNFQEKWCFQNNSTILFFSLMHPVNSKLHVEGRSNLTVLDIIFVTKTSTIADILNQHPRSNARCKWI